jgi:hypothetical protein
VANTIAKEMQTIWVNGLVQTSLWWVGLAEGKITPEMLSKSSVLFGDIGRHHLVAQITFPCRTLLYTAR